LTVRQSLLAIADEVIEQPKELQIAALQ